MAETFAELDAGPLPGRPAWLHAGARQAEAGFEDPSLGWVGVRADLSGGAVHASLVPGSAEAMQALGSHMDGLHRYLAEEHTGVASLTMASPDTGMQGSGQGGQHAAAGGQQPDPG
ncbi:MAG: hypothetical protein WCE75_05710, partial [Terracidiphilus sp.]